MKVVFCAYWLLILTAGLLSPAAYGQSTDGPIAFPYRPADELTAEARAISDALDAYIDDWLAGKVSAEIPDELIPSGTDENYQDFRLVRYDEIVPLDQWVVRRAAPINLDSLYNLFPDPNCTYLISWAMLVPFGHKVYVEGEYPYARFFDIQTVGSYHPGGYNARFNGQGELPIVDVDIPALPGNTNPFRVGANRYATNRKYRAEFVMAMGEPTETNPKALQPPFRDTNPVRYGTGIMNIGPLGYEETFDEVPWFIGLATGSIPGEWSAGEMWLRYYAPDAAKGPMAGIPLPKMYYQTPEGVKYFIAYNDAEAKAATNATQPLAEQEMSDPESNDYAQGWSKLYGILRTGLNGLRALGGLSDEDIRYWDLALAGRSEKLEGVGGLETSKTLVPYTNYITRDMSIAEGKVMVLTGKLPTFPDTRGGAKTMTEAQMRYWSITLTNTGNILRVGEAIGSIMDDEVALDDERRYVIAFSLPEDKPENATQANGVSWVEWPRVSRIYLMLRWMSVAPNWSFELTPDQTLLPPANVVPTAAQYDPSLMGENNHDGVLGEYQPRVHYLTQEEFEALGNTVSFDNIPIWEEEPWWKTFFNLHTAEATEQESSPRMLPDPTTRPYVYPNPTAGGEVTIWYKVAHDGPARLTLHDLFGREIAVIAEGKTRKGAQKVTFDTAYLTQGSYFCRVTTPQGRAARRLIVK